MVIDAGDERLATHGRRRSTIEERLPDQRREPRHRGREHWETRAATVAPAVLTCVRAVFGSDDVLLKLRAVRAAVTHHGTFPKERGRAACARARATSATSATAG